MTTMSYLLALATLGLTILIMATPMLARPIVRGADAALKSIDARPARWAVIAAFAWMGWLGYACVRDERPMHPHWHDEHAYLVQARMIAAGDFWLPSPPSPDSFDTFHLLVTPAYAVKYPPGTAMAYVPGMWLGIPWYVTTFAIAGVSLGLLCYLGTQLVSPLILPIALAGAATSGYYQTTSVQALSQPVLALVVLTSIRVALAEYRCHRRWHFVLVGLLAGYAVLVRPADAILLMSPVAGLMVWAARRSQSAGTATKDALIGLVATLPAALLMLYINRGITGSFWHTPWGLYAEQYQPGEHLGFARPVLGQLRDGLPRQKYEFYDQFVRDALSNHSVRYAIGTWMGGVRCSYLFDLLARPALMAIAYPLLALIGFCRRTFWLPLIALVATLTLYTIYPFVNAAYFFTLIPILWLAVTRGSRTLLDLVPPVRQPAVTAGGVLALALVVLVSQQPVGANVTSRMNETLFHEVTTFEQWVAPRLDRPAIVFFRFDPWATVHDERVYNDDTASPTAGPVVRVHWLDDVRNRALLRAIEPTRRDSRVYVYDRGTGWLHDLGLLPNAMANGTTPTQANRITLAAK